MEVLHKPRYVDPGQLDGHGRTAAQVATANGKDDVVALLQGLDAGVDVAAGGGSGGGNDVDGGDGD